MTTTPEPVGAIIEVDGQKYQLVITGDAEVVPGDSKEE